MIRVFIDTSVFFAACYSEEGASFEIFRRALQGAQGAQGTQGTQGRIELVISEYVLEELKRNIAAKSHHPQDRVRLQLFLDHVPFRKVDPTRGQVVKAARYTRAKDAPVVAAAKRAKVDYLVSLDQRDLVGNEAVEQGSGLRVMLPGDLLKILRAEEEE